MKRIAFALLLMFIAFSAAAQQKPKLLIVHADDLGVAHSVDAATMKALDLGGVTSASIMVPCPWLPEVAAYAQSHAAADLGIHLTLTSEWAPFRWRPLSSRTSLVDKRGYLYATESDAAAHIDPRDAEAELRAQIARSREMGIRPTHVDSHMGTLYQNKALFGVLLRIARDERVPARISKAHLQEAFRADLMRPNDVVVDRIISIGPDVSPDRWAAWYIDEIRKIQPGLTEIIVHLGYDDAELRAITANHPHWGAAWRQRDFDFVTSDEFRRVLRENDIQLVTWREAAKIMRAK